MIKKQALLREPVFVFVINLVCYVRKQCHDSCSLHCGCDVALMNRAGSCNSSWEKLTTLGDISLKSFGILIIYG